MSGLTDYIQDRLFWPTVKAKWRIHYKLIMEDGLLFGAGQDDERLNHERYLLAHKLAGICFQ